jgi:glucose/arabinose dehydrogenase
LCAAEQGFELPAEAVVILREGADYGWPQCYNDGQSQKLVLAPDGQKGMLNVAEGHGKAANAA